METQESSHLRFLVPGLRARIERSSRLVTGGRGSRRRVVCARYRTRHRARTGQLSFCLAGRAARVQRNAHPARAATPFMFQRTANYPAHDLAVMLTTVRHETGAGCWCSFSGMPSHPSTVVRKMSRLSLAPAECRGPSLAMPPAVRRRGWGGTQSSYGCSGTVTGLPASARMTTRTLAGVVSLALRETA